MLYTVNHVEALSPKLMGRVAAKLLLGSQNKTSAVAEMGERLNTIDMGRKVGEVAVPLSVGGAGSPSNTMSPGPRPTSALSGILIPPAI